MSKLGSAVIAIFGIAVIAFVGWWAYTITRPLPASGLVTNTHSVLVKSALIYTICVQPTHGKDVCRSVSHQTWKRCSTGTYWPTCDKKG